MIVLTISSECSNACGLWFRKHPSCYTEKEQYAI